MNDFQMTEPTPEQREQRLAEMLRLTTDTLLLVGQDRDLTAVELATLQAKVASVHKAKGRYHSQLAMCDLYDACGLSNVRPISGQKEFGENHD